MERTRSNVLMASLLGHLKDVKTRKAYTVVSKHHHEAERLTREHITVHLCYSIDPKAAIKRYPNLSSVKVKGMPRPCKFELGIPEDWGGEAGPWVKELITLSDLERIQFTRMVVSDENLLDIANTKGLTLKVLKLYSCSGFSTNGLLEVTQKCKNLQVLSLRESDITEIDGRWLEELANSNRSLRELDCCGSFLERIEVNHLVALVMNCSLLSLKIEELALVDLRNVLSIATNLEQFFGSLDFEDVDYLGFKFPQTLVSWSVNNFKGSHLQLLLPLAESLKELDLSVSSLCCDEYCIILSICYNLEILKTTTSLGDLGLEVVATSCPKLKRIRILTHLYQPIRESVVTSRGLIALARGCQKLQYLAAFVSHVSNDALACIGEYLKHLNDFRIVIQGKIAITELPLDNGVRSLLEGCCELQKFAVDFGVGGLSIVGVSYIQTYGRRLTWLFLAYAIKGDMELLELCKGCRTLEKLEIRGGLVTESAFATQLPKLVSLKYIWANGFLESPHNVDLLPLVRRPYWNVELIPKPNPHEAMFVAYRSLAGPRQGNPSTVRVLTSSFGPSSSHNN